MRAASAGLSLTIHVALGAGIVWGTLGVRPDRPSPPRTFVIPAYHAASRPAPPATPIIDGDVSLPLIEFPSITPVGVAPVRPAFDVRPLPGVIAAGAAGGEGDEPVDVSIVDDQPAILAGPVPTYPELLRQAGIEGRVVLEAVVDSAGRIELSSLTVVWAGDPGFVAPAQRALAGTLFRPGRVHGRPVRVRVRVPIDFILRGRGSRGG